MIRSTTFLVLSGAGLLLLTGLILFGSDHGQLQDEKRKLVSVLGLTDLALFSEARYTRHPSQADLFSAFQDAPAAFEHFPSGSLIAPAPAGQYRWIAVRKQDDRLIQ